MAAANASEGIPVGYFSIEMDRDSLLERIWSSVSKVNYAHIIDPKRLNLVESTSLAAAKDTVATWPLFIEDYESYSVSEIEARARLLIRQQNVGLIFVDYMQIVDAPGRDERQQMTKVSKAMRRLAKGEKIGVVGLSQMPRPKDQNMNKRPTKFDLKESGSLENDSNAVILIFRPVDEYDQYTGKDELIVGKKRSGPTGIEPAYYHGQFMRFESRAL
jgi:replicative DNA helicase